MSAEIIEQIRSGGILYILLVIAITMHEFGHAYAADKLGCVIPRLLGRVTVNPLAHMDLYGTVIFPIICIALSVGAQFPLIFGWGKPVQMIFTNPKTYVRDDVISTLGGSLMNLVVAFISAVLLAIFAGFGLEKYAAIASYSIQINAVLFVINMLPIPPLDGGRIFRHLVKMTDSTYISIARYGIFIFFAVIFFPPTKQIFISLVSLLSSVFFFIADLIYGVFTR